MTNKNVTGLPARPAQLWQCLILLSLECIYYLLGWQWRRYQTVPILSPLYNKS